MTPSRRRRSGVIIFVILLLSALFVWSRIKQTAVEHPQSVPVQSAPLRTPARLQTPP